MMTTREPNPPLSEATLLDYFAGKALAAIVASQTDEEGCRPADKFVAAEAYDLALAMMAERQKLMEATTDRSSE